MNLDFSLKIYTKGVGFTMAQEQIDELLERQIAIEAGINKLLSIYHLDSASIEEVNPTLNVKEAAKLLGVGTSVLMKGCKDGDVPHRRLGTKYLFSRIALFNWLHHVNLSFLENRLDTKHKYSIRGDSIDNWLRISINPVTGLKEEYHVIYDPSPGESQVMGSNEAAELLGLSRDKLYQLSHGFVHYQFPVERDGGRFTYSRDELLKYMETPIYKKFKSEYDAVLKVQKERIAASKARKEAERLENEARKVNHSKSKQE
jgi:excisionase family DNA binding protein